VVRKFIVKRMLFSAPHTPPPLKGLPAALSAYRNSFSCHGILKTTGAGNFREPSYLNSWPGAVEGATVSVKLHCFDWPWWP
jgi:hypothetical protein